MAPDASSVAWMPRIMVQNSSRFMGWSPHEVDVEDGLLGSTPGRLVSKSGGDYWITNRLGSV